MPELPLIQKPPIGGRFNRNLYYEPDTSEGQPGLVITPGLKLAVDLTETDATLNKPIRGMVGYGYLMYLVCDTDLIQWDLSTDTVTVLKEDFIPTGDTPVSMAMNKASSQQIAVTTGGSGALDAYLYTWTTGAPGTYSAVALGFIPTNVTYQDGYFLVGRVSIYPRVYCSDVDAITGWTDYATKESIKDELAGVFTNARDLWVFGNKGTEIWYYTAASSGLPFGRRAGAILDAGTWSVYTIQLLDDSIFWLNNRGEVCKSEGYGYRVISPPRLNDAIRSYAESDFSYWTNARAFTTMWAGHPWYVINFPDMSATWVYDVAAAAAERQPWFRWCYGTGTAHALGMCSVFLRGRQFIGDRQNTGYIYELTDDYYTDHDEDKTCVAYIDNIAKENRRIIYNGVRLRLDHTTDKLATPAQASTTLTGTHSAGATTLTVASSTGFAASTTAVRIGSYTYDISSVPDGTTIVISSGLSVEVAGGTTVDAIDYYTKNPKIQLSATSGYSNTKTDLTSPMRWSALGSHYDSSLSFVFRGSGKLKLLGASADMKVCKS